MSRTFNYHFFDQLLIDRGLNPQSLSDAIHQYERYGTAKIGVRNIQRWRKGQVIPNEGFVKRLADYFNLTVGDFYLDDNLPTEISSEPLALVRSATRMTSHDLTMDRRRFLSSATAAVCNSSELITTLSDWHLSNISQSKPNATHIYQDVDVEHMMQMARECKVWNRKFGGEACRKAVVGMLNEVSTALQTTKSPNDQLKLYSVMADLSATAASMAWDLNLERLAQDYYQLALRSAQASGDHTFGVNVLANMARQLFYLDDAAHAMELIQLAKQGLPATASPRLRAMLATREAWAHAALGNDTAFLRVTDQAAETLSLATTNDDEPYWIKYFDEAELAGVTGGRYLDLARQNPTQYAQKAIDDISTAISTRTVIDRGHVLDKVGLAECHFLLGDTTYATELSHDALNAAQMTKSGRVRAQLATLRSQMMTYTDQSHVQDVQHRLDTFLATASESFT